MRTARSLGTVPPAHVAAHFKALMHSFPNGALGLGALKFFLAPLLAIQHMKQLGASQHTMVVEWVNVACHKQAQNVERQAVN